MDNDIEVREEEKIVLSPEIQKRMLKFFLKTSIPRKAKQERMKKEKALPEQEGQ